MKFQLQLFVVVLGFVALANCRPQEMPEISYREVKEAFELFKATHKRSYLSPEIEQHRFGIFAYNYGYIQGHNFEFHNLNLHTYTLGVNSFADLTVEEFQQEFTQNLQKPEHVQQFEKEIWRQLPDSIDWTTHGVVSPVKDQGPLGASWPFSVVGAIEGVQALDSGNLVELSEQNLVDCCRIAKRNCSFTTDGFDYVVTNKGIDTEKSYPFSGEPEKCRFNRSDVGAIITGQDYVQNGNETDLMDAVANVGPISVVLNASPRSFQFYKSGVYNDPSCDPVENHAALVVGYGKDNSTSAEFWKVKNSWGVNWGEKGYIRLARFQKNLCGIANYGVYPLVHNDV